MINCSHYTWTSQKEQETIELNDLLILRDVITCSKRRAIDFSQARPQGTSGHILSSNS